MVASSIPCKLSLCADRAQARAGDSHASSGIDVACPTTQSALAIASPNELHGDSWPSSSTGGSSFCSNHQYSVTAVTTSTGAIAERYAYSAYGQPTVLDASASVLSNSAINNRYTYTGREWDATLGLHHFRARWMHPIAGRFLVRDPIGLWDYQNLYCYVRNSPWTLIDPIGLKCVGPILQNPQSTHPNSTITYKRVEPGHKDIGYYVKIGEAWLNKNSNLIWSKATDTTLEVGNEVTVNYFGWFKSEHEVATKRSWSLSCVSVKTSDGEKCVVVPQCNTSPDFKERYGDLMTPLYELGVASYTQVVPSDPEEVVSIEWRTSWSVGWGARYQLTALTPLFEIQLSQGRVRELFKGEDNGVYVWKCDCENP
jgi:RHS repeat-associated protein